MPDSVLTIFVCANSQNGSTWRIHQNGKSKKIRKLPKRFHVENMSESSDSDWGGNDNFFWFDARYSN